MKLGTITMKRTPNGLLLTTIHKDQYYHRLYQGYTASQANQLFREYVIAEDAKIFREVKPQS